MNKQPDESIIAKLLEDLRNKGRNRDINAIQKTVASIEKIVKNKIRDEQIIDALTQMANTDPDKIVRDSARNALDKLDDESILPERNMHSRVESSETVRAPEPVTDLSSFLRRYGYQIMGFIGWYMFATLLSSGGLVGLITTPATLIVLISYARSKQSKGVAGGILVAVALNFVVSLVKGLSLNAWCLIPFWNTYY